MAGQKKSGSNAGPSGPAPLNPERLPQLIGKYSKILGKDLDEIVVTYNTSGVTLGIKGKAGTPFAHLKVDTHDLSDYRAEKEKANKPSASEAAAAFRNKFELRLNREFPKGGLKSGSESDIQAFLESLPFRERRALMMTQKQFSANYPNGYTQE